MRRWEGGVGVDRPPSDFLRPFQFRKGLGRPRRSSVPRFGVRGIECVNRLTKDGQPYRWAVGEKGSDPIFRRAPAAGG